MVSAEKGANGLIFWPIFRPWLSGWTSPDFLMFFVAPGGMIDYPRAPSFYLLKEP